MRPRAPTRRGLAAALAGPARAAATGLPGPLGALAALALAACGAAGGETGPTPARPDAAAPALVWSAPELCDADALPVRPPLASGKRGALCVRDALDGDTACARDADCGSPYLACACGVCRPRACTGDLDCPSGWACSAGACAPGCGGDADCADGERCDRVCRAACASDAECPATELCDGARCAPRACDADAAVCGDGRRCVETRRPLPLATPAPAPDESEVWFSAGCDLWRASADPAAPAPRWRLDENPAVRGTSVVFGTDGGACLTEPVPLVEALAGSERPPRTLVVTTGAGVLALVTPDPERPALAAAFSGDPGDGPRWATGPFSGATPLPGGWLVFAAGTLACADARDADGELPPGLTCVGEQLFLGAAPLTAGLGLARWDAATRRYVTVGDGPWLTAAAVPTPREGEYGLWPRVLGLGAATAARVDVPGRGAMLRLWFTALAPAPGGGPAHLSIGYAAADWPDVGAPPPTPTVSPFNPVVDRVVAFSEHVHASGPRLAPVTGALWFDAHDAHGVLEAPQRATPLR